MNLPGFALSRPAVIYAGFAILVFWGIWSFETAPRSEDPEFTIHTAVVETDWPGAPAEKIELLITDPIEEAMSAIDEIEYVRSITTPGRCSVYIEALENLTDVDDVWDKARARLASLAPDLPSGSSEPLLNSDFADTAIMMLAMYQSPGAAESAAEQAYTPREMEVIAESIQEELERIGGIAKVELTGVQREMIYLEIDGGRWSQLGLTTGRLRDLLEHRNIVAPGGTIETGWGRFDIEPSGAYQGVAEIGETVVGMRADGLNVNLEQLGFDVSRGYTQPPRALARFGLSEMAESQPCIVLSITMIEGENVVRMGDAIHARLEEFRQSELPTDIHLAVVADESSTVREGIRNFTTNLLRAVIAVVLIAYLLIGMRIALVMAAAIPVVLCSAFGVSRLFGVQVDTIAIAALIVVLGMVVDNAIEVADNVHRYLEEGLSRREATLKGSKEIGGSILVATLTTVAAFGPMLTLPGSTGEYLFGLPLVVCVSLLMSYIVAMTLTTLMSYRVLRGEVKTAPLPWLLSRAWGILPFRTKRKPPAFGEVYRSIVGRCIRAKWLTVGIALALFVLAFRLPLGSRFFPDDFRAQFVVNVHLPEGSPLSKTDEVCRQIEGIIRDISHQPNGKNGLEAERVESVLTYVGESGPRFRLGVDMEPPATNFAFMVVNTAGPQLTDALIEEVRQASFEEVIGARVVPFKFAKGPPVRSPIALRILGEDKQTLHQIAEDVKSALRSVPETRDIHDSWGNETYQVFVRADEEKAKFAGVDQASIAQTLNAFFSGHYLTTYREGDHAIPVYMRLPQSQRVSLDAVRAVYVEGRTGKVPIDAVANIEKRWVPSKILRYDGERNLEVRARVSQGALANAALEKALPEIQKIEASLPPGYRIEIAGELGETNDSQNELAVCFVISLVLIIMCLVVKYNGYSKALMILITLPLAFTGGIFGLVLTNQPLGFMAQLGLLALAGIVLNDAIVLVDFVETQVKDRLKERKGDEGAESGSCSGLPRDVFHDCVTQGSALRVRAITLTTLTTMGGLLPLAMGGGPLWEPLATVIICGLLFASFLTLFVLPSMFAILVENFGIQVARPAGHS